jgi:RNA polymerase sigma-70 factor (ECF subfamily)
LSEIRQLETEVAGLVPRAQAGDAVARDDLLRRCHGTIYRWALVFTGDRDEAEDITQEVLVRVYRYLPGFSGRARFTTWLYRLTRNAALGIRRTVASRLVLARRVGDRLAAEPTAGDDPIDRLQAGRMREVVLSLFQELPVRQREVFHLADLEGLTPTEIAEQLGMNPVTVRAHLFRARRALRARLLAQHPELVEERGR